MEMLSDRDAFEFVVEMQDYLTQLRAIPKEVSPEFANTLGGACRDPRIRDGNPVGPFVDEEAFNQVLLHSDDSSRRGHNVVFTHADLNLQNILVDQVVKLDGTRGWKISGIVDWENSGYYPEYWDYTKALFEGFRYNER
jgi:aminoglycoside phosphotransferase (APT) family kinase protein